MKILFIIALGIFIISCEGEVEHKNANPKEQLILKKQNNYIIRGQTFDHSLIYNGNLNEFDSIKLKPDSLVLSFDKSTLRIKPTNNYTVGNYPYSIYFYANSIKYTYQDEFDVVYPNFIIANLKMNFLILGEKNPIDISGGYYLIKDCIISSKDSVEIERYDDYHYIIVPKQKGKVRINMETMIDGNLKKIGSKEFQVITGDETVNELIK